LRSPELKFSTLDDTSDDVVSVEGGLGGAP
jgi:hypothetical protein